MRAALVLLVGALLAGCGSTSGTAAPDIDYLPGARVGEMAERELEAAYPRMAPGTVTCPDLDWRVGASVRCLQVARLSGGRQVSIRGTVTVTDLADGGRLHVELDDVVAEFGISSEHLSADLETRARTRLRPAPTAVRCPYLSGPVGTTVRCRVVQEGRAGVVVARVVGRTASRNATSYVFDWKGFDAR